MDNYKFMQNINCEYFPCHYITNTENFNCLFCYCPLYSYKNCGGQYKILKNNIKDCSTCLIPHNKNNYDFIIKKLQIIQNKLIKGEYI